jgi:hypothetical protein
VRRSEPAEPIPVVLGENSRHMTSELKVDPGCATAVVADKLIADHPHRRIWLVRQADQGVPVARKAHPAEPGYAE